MQHILLASNDEGWSLGGSILTFLLPMLAFVAVAVTLLVLYTKPGLVPGRSATDGDSPVAATRQPGLPPATGQAPAATSTDAGQAGESVSTE